MSRYTGPRRKRIRSLDLDLPAFTRKTAGERNFPPGQHGRNFRRAPSEYGRQLREKQKIRLNYGLSEAQLRNTVREARRLEGSTGERLIQLLERRLDNIVFRAGFAPTIPAARQMVNHGHFKLNGHRADIASMLLRPGDTLVVKDKSKAVALLKEQLESGPFRPSWLEVNAGEMTVKVMAMPSSDQIPTQFDTQLVIEFYSKRL
jgi:small subunit ribosomal protein S4